jgi:hypothetical protein
MYCYHYRYHFKIWSSLFIAISQRKRIFDGSVSSVPFHNRWTCDICLMPNRLTRKEPLYGTQNFLCISILVNFFQILDPNELMCAEWAN